MKLLIKGGTVVRASGTERADVLVSDGIIERIASDLAVSDDATVLDAAGCYLFAGFIDTHTHFDLDLGVTVTADNFETGTKAAVVGGTTTVLDFATQDRGMTMQQALELWHKKAEKSSCNYGFHMALSEWNDARREEVDAMIEQGVTSFKMYMVYDAMKVDDGKIYEAMKYAAERNCVIGVHCENFDLLNARIRELKAQGRLEPMAHAESRPAAVEADGVARLMRIGELADAPCWVVHLSTEQGLSEVEAARSRGIEVYAETCPQYLVLDVTCYQSADGEKFVMSPPLRYAADREALLKALGEGSVDFIGTDHCSFTMEQKALGKGDFSKVPNGGAGVQNRAELVFTYAVQTGCMSLERMAETMSERAAKLFGMYPRKGVLLEGSDADIVVFDPNAPHIISHRTNLHNCDNSPYEGIKAVGKTRDVVLNGELVVKDGTLIRPYCGKYVFRKPSDRFRQ